GVPDGPEGESTQFGRALHRVPPRPPEGTNGSGGHMHSGGGGFGTLPIGARRMLLGALFAISIALVCAIGAARAAGAPAAEPYGANDAGGFLNVLPSGENGTDNALQLAQFELNGTTPPHFEDQL